MWCLSRCALYLYQQRVCLSRCMCVPVTLCAVVVSTTCVPVTVYVVPVTVCTVSVSTSMCLLLLCVLHLYQNVYLSLCVFSLSTFMCPSLCSLYLYKHLWDATVYCICVNTVPVTVCLYQHPYTSHRVYSISAPTCQLRRVQYTCQHYMFLLPFVVYLYLHI